MKGPGFDKWQNLMKVFLRENIGSYSLLCDLVVHWKRSACRLSNNSGILEDSEWIKSPPKNSSIFRCISNPKAGWGPYLQGTGSMLHWSRLSLVQPLCTNRTRRALGLQGGCCPPFFLQFCSIHTCTCRRVVALWAAWASPPLGCVEMEVNRQPGFVQFPKPIALFLEMEEHLLSKDKTLINRMLLCSKPHHDPLRKGLTTKCISRLYLSCCSSLHPKATVETQSFCLAVQL